MSALAWSKFQDVVGVNGIRPAVLHGDKQISFSELEKAGEDWASTIAATAGKRVILYAENSIDVIAAALGVWRCNAIPVWINAAAPVDHVLLALQETKAVCVVSKVSGLADVLPCRVISECANILSENRITSVIGENEIGSIVYTSGSTGRPKGVVQRADTLIDGAARVAKTLGYKTNDRILCPVPFAFDYGWGQLLSMAFGGMALMLPEPNNAFGICDAITRHKPTVLAGVPAVFGNLLSGLSAIRDIDCSSIRLITNTGSRIPDTVLKSLEDTFPHADLSLNYGLTETYRTASLPTNMTKLKPLSVGSAIENVDIAIIDPDSNICKTNEIGEVIHRGAGIFESYWNDPNKTAAVRRPDPINASSGQVAVYTGDLGYLDDDGHLFVTGRKDRQIKSMGVRVSSDEIEDILLATKHVTEVAITSKPDDIVGDMVVAFVVGLPDRNTQEDLRDLKRDARTKLSPYMIPRVYHLLDALPRNTNGKVDYPKLKRLAAGGA